MSANPLMIYNTLSREKEVFAPLNPPFAGMYVCGPTVYGDAHLGHARPAITFDLVFRYLKHLGYKVRYVRNITDVGHLENDQDQGEDKIGKKARLEQLEPMEVVQWFTDRYHQDMDRLNVLRPSIEPRASGHITEQIEMIRAIILSGYAYEVNGSVYFDVQAYHKKHHYGILSGRQIEDLIANTRDLQSQQEKRNPLDFALWKKAGPDHIMRWPSPWSEGFPGWHLECSAMSTKYLGETFDIHGGGLDLLFPHHECEIAQSRAASKKQAVRYWMHNNMITINGQKMGKSLGNFITLREFFTGEHEQLSQAYDPMTIRFFMLQAHYRSTLDFSNEALQAAQKGLARLLQAQRMIRNLPVSKNPGLDVSAISDRCEAALLDDFNSPVAIAHLFDATKTIHAVNEGRESLDTKGIETLQATFDTYLGDVMGIGPMADNENSGQSLVDGLMKIILDLRAKARLNKDWEASDQIRETLEELNIRIKDGKDGADWSYK